MTFTDKAAGEMRSRLAALGVDGVRARTFHASALQQLHYFGRGPGGVLPSKALMLRHIANSLPRPYRFRPAATSRQKSSGQRTDAFRPTATSSSSAIGERPCHRT